MARKRAMGKGSWLDFPGAFTAAGLAIFLVAAWPTVIFHGNARWIGEGLWVGIPLILTLSVIAAIKWASRDERKLARLRDERLRAEGNHPDQLRARWERQFRLQALHDAEQRRKAQIQAAEQARLAAQQRKQRLRDEIQHEQQRRKERHHHHHHQRRHETNQSANP